MEHYDGEGFFLYGDPAKASQLKNRQAVSKEIIKGLKTISVDPENLIHYGSWVYKSQQYPGDIDVTELVSHCCDIETATKEFVKDTQRVIKNIQKKGNNSYVGDIKAGWDPVFKINIGDLTFNKVGKPKILNYCPDQIRELLESVHRLKLMTTPELNNFLKLVPNKIDQLGFETLHKELRKKWLLRWDPEEVIQGYKILSRDRVLTLAEAINMPTMTKVDMWTNVNGRFVEFSNVLSYYLVDKKKKKILLNFINKPEQLIPQLKQEIQKYAFTELEFKPYKMVKRMWSLARITKDYKMIEILTPIMQTDLGRISQINSEMETIVLMLESIKKPPMKEIIDEIDSWKYRLDSVYELDIDFDNLIKIFDKITSSKTTNTKGNKKYIIEKLTKIRETFKHIVEKETMIQLKRFNLYPPPPNYLPAVNFSTLRDGENLVIGDLDCKKEGSGCEDCDGNGILFNGNIGLKGGIVEGDEYPSPFKKNKVKAFTLGDWDEGDYDPKGNFIGDANDKRFGSSIATAMYQKLANAYRRVSCSDKARPLKEGEMHPKCWNFCGPGTRIDLDEVRNYPPYDNIDSVCKTHDIDYHEALGKPDKEQLIRQADNKMLNSLEQYKSEPGYNLARLAIQGKVSAENLLPSFVKKNFSEHFGAD